eukprot:1197496-Amphidinium_carterae.1
MSFQDITAGRATWFNPAASRDFSFYSDLCWLRHAVDRNEPEALQDAWWSCLLPEVGACVRSAAEKGPWRWVLGEAAMPGKLTVPAVEKKVHGQRLLGFPELNETDLHCMFVTNPAMYEVVFVRFLSPVGVASACSTPTPDLPCQPWGVALHEPVPLLQAAARRGFHRLSKPVLLRIARKLGWEVSEKPALFDLLTTLIRKAWPGCTDENVLHALEQRTQKSEHIAEIQRWLKSDGMEWLEEDDKEEVSKENAKTSPENDLDDDENEKEEQESNFNQSMTALREKVRKPTTSRRGASSASATAAAPPKKPRKFGPIPNWLGKEIKESQAQNIVPEGFTLYNDSYNRRWLLSYASTDFRSRSWRMYGYNASAKLLAQHAWFVHCKRTGEPCPLDIEPKELS